MRTNRKKRGFTIVELVIVVAVIAILAAVLIPTFASLIKKAKNSNDITTVRQFDTLLQGLEAYNGKAVSFAEAVELLKEEGIDIDNFKLASDEHALGFDPVEQTFVLLENDKVIFPANYKGTSNNLYVFDTPDYVLKNAANAYGSDVAAASEKIVPQMKEILRDGKAHYVSKDIAVAMCYKGGPKNDEIYEVKNSLDSPYLTQCNISYVDTEEEEVTFNLGNNNPERNELAQNLYDVPLKSSTQVIKASTVLSSLTIDNANATVNHYGYVNAVTIKNVKEYHCFAERWAPEGTSSIGISGSGKIVLEKGYAADRTWDYSKWNIMSKDTTISYPNVMSIAIMAPSVDDGQVRNIEIDIEDEFSAYYPNQQVSYGFTIKIESGVKNVNLTINAKGGTKHSITIFANGKVADGNITDSRGNTNTSNYRAFQKGSSAGTFEGYVDEEGNFHAGTRPAASSASKTLEGGALQEQALSELQWALECEAVRRSLRAEI